MSRWTEEEPRGVDAANKGWHGVARTSGQARISTTGFTDRATTLRLTPREAG
jgi:hypothetical protein